MATYQHSEVFASLKKVEDYGSNLTSYQWLHVLDYFLEAAIDPIATCAPHFMDSYFAKAVAWQFSKPTMKYTRGPKADLPILLFKSLLANGAEKRVHQKEMHLNRGILFGVIQIFQKIVNSYVRAHDPVVATPRMIAEARALATSLGGTHLYPATRQVEFWYSRALQFKALIVGKFTRLALMQAQRTYKEVGFVEDLDDIIQVYLIYVNKAIERCDSRQGVLTTYIQTWFYSARFEILQQVKAKNAGVEVDESLPDEGSDSNFVDTLEAEQELAINAKAADPEGYVRVMLAIPEAVSVADYRKLKLFTTA